MQIQKGIHGKKSRPITVFAPTINEPMKMTQSNFFLPSAIFHHLTNDLLYQVPFCAFFTRISKYLAIVQVRFEWVSIQGKEYFEILFGEISVGMRKSEEEIQGGDISWLYIFIMTSNGKTVDGEEDAERSV